MGSADSGRAQCPRNASSSHHEGCGPDDLGVDQEWAGSDHPSASPRPRRGPWDGARSRRRTRSRGRSPRGRSAGSAPGTGRRRPGPKWCTSAPYAVVVVDDDHQREPEPDHGLELARSPSARRRRRARRPGSRCGCASAAPIAVASPSPIGLVGLREAEASLVRHGQEHARVAHEVAGVDGDHPLAAEAGRRASTVAVRGSIRPSVLRSSYGTSRQRISAAMRSRSASVRRPGRAVTRARTWSATSATSPCTPRSTGRWRPGAVGVEVDLHHGGSGADQGTADVSSTCSGRSPTRRRGPTPRSAPRRAARRSHPRRRATTGSPWNRPLATALVASSAPVLLGEQLQRSRRAPRAPRPATNTGALRGLQQRREARDHSLGDADGGSGGRAGRQPSSGTSSACTESGRLSTTVRRSVRAASTAARRQRGHRVAGSSTVIGTAPTARASASWST